MRTTTTLGTTAGLTALAAIAAASAAPTGCVDTTRIEVTGSGGAGGSTSSSTSSSGTAGSGMGECVSNAQCGGDLPICDTTQQKCVGCLVDEDCAVRKPGSVCSFGACGCKDAALTYCAADTVQPGRCVDTQTTAKDCGACGKPCYGGCTAGKCSDKWEPVSNQGRPAARWGHVAVSAGTRMIVWGGYGGGAFRNDGGVYDPATAKWSPINTVDAPSPRRFATAVWTGTQMIVWGGEGPNGYLGDGAAYDPVKNQWTPLATGIINGRSSHTAVVTNNAEMIVWGGQNGSNPYLDDGARLFMNVWGTVSAFLPGRREHTAVWATTAPFANQMIIFGGYGLDPVNPNYLSSGGVFDPTTDGWIPLDQNNVPSPRARHTAVWAEAPINGMIVFGGYNGSSYLADGGAFNGVWSGLQVAPNGHADHTAAWVSGASRMIVFGGQTTSGLSNAAYALEGATFQWTKLPTVPLAARYRHTMVVVGTKAIVWGGDVGGGNPADDGAAFDASP